MALTNGRVVINCNPFSTNTVSITVFISHFREIEETIFSNLLTMCLYAYQY